MYVCILIVSSRHPVCVKLQCLKYFEGFNVHLYDQIYIRTYVLPLGFDKRG